ncbi:hypothetical protein Tco_0047471 [Tanacetum coccineum]
MSEGYFIGRLAEHFGLVSDEGLMGLSVIACVLPIINLDELVKFNICDVPAPVQAPQPPPATAQGRTMPQRLARLEEEVHAPVHAPQPPPAAAQGRTMPQRLARLDEEVHGPRWKEIDNVGEVSIIWNSC